MPLNPYQSLVSLLSNILEAYTTAFFVVDPKSRQLNLVAAQSLSKYLPATVSLPLEQSGILAQVQKVGQTIQMDKLQEVSPELSSALPFYRDGESHIKGLFATPVGDGAGVLYVDTKYAWGFSDKQKKWIREIATVLQDHLERERCLSQQRDYARILELWHTLDQASLQGYTIDDYYKLVITRCSQFLGTEYGFLALREPGEENFRLLACTSNVPRVLVNQSFLVKQGLVGWILQNQKALLISRLNPHTPDHFLFSPSEGLPHHGTFWGMSAETSLGHSIVVAFLARSAMEWGADDQFAISHFLHFFHLLFEQTLFKEECEHLQTRDLTTGLYNRLAFESRLEGLLATSMQSSTPFTLAILQLEPWQILLTKASPKQVSSWQRDLAVTLCGKLPASTIVGQLAENRFGFLFAGMTPQDASYYLSPLTDPRQNTFTVVPKGSRLHTYLGVVGFPQDGTRSEELLPLAYQHLFSTFRSKIEKTGT